MITAAGWSCCSSASRTARSRAPSAARVQPIAMRYDPFVVTIRQQVPRVGLDDPGELGAGRVAIAAAHRTGCREFALELDGVHVGARVAAPLHRADIRFDPVLVIRPGQAKLMEELSQVVSALRLRDVGPEARRDLLPRLGGAGMERDVSQERVQARPAQPDRAPGDPQRETAEDLEVQGDVHERGHSPRAHSAPANAASETISALPQPAKRRLCLRLQPRDQPVARFFFGRPWPSRASPLPRPLRRPSSWPGRASRRS